MRLTNSLERKKRNNNEVSKKCNRKTKMWKKEIEWTASLPREEERKKHTLKVEYRERKQGKTLITFEQQNNSHVDKEIECQRMETNLRWNQNEKNIYWKNTERDIFMTFLLDCGIEYLCIHMGLLCDMMCLRFGCACLPLFYLFRFVFNEFSTECVIFSAVRCVYVVLACLCASFISNTNRLRRRMHKRTIKPNDAHVMNSSV